MSSVAGEPPADGDKAAKPEPPKKEKLGILAVGVFAFCSTSAGPFGVEPCVRQGSAAAILALYAIAIFVMRPIIIIIMGELATWMNTNHGYMRWVARPRTYGRSLQRRVSALHEHHGHIS